MTDISVAVSKYTSRAAGALDAPMAVRIPVLAMLAMFASSIREWIPGCLSIACEEFVIVGVLLAVELIFAARGRNRAAEKKALAKLSTDSKRQCFQKVSSGKIAPAKANDKEVSLLCNQLQAAARADDLAKCEALFQRIKTKGAHPSAATHGIVIGAYSRKGNAEGCQRWLEALVQAGLGPPNAISVNMTITACAKTGDIDRAEFWLQRMSSMGVEPDLMSYNAVLSACARAQNVAQAEAWMEKMSTDGLEPNLVSYSTMLHACAKAGDLLRAEEWLGRLLSVGIDANAICYNTVINACVKANNFDRAAYWIEEMGKRGVQPTVNSYSTIIDGFAKAGDPQKAEAFLTQMMDAGVKADAVCINMLLSAYSKAGDSGRARALYERMCQCSFEFSADNFHLFMGAHTKENDAMGIAFWFQEMRTHRVRADRACFNTALAIFQRSCNLKGLMALLAELEAGGLDTERTALQAMMNACFRLNDASLAEVLLLERLKDGESADKKSLSMLLETFAQKGDTGKVKKWLERMDARNLEIGPNSFSSLVKMCLNLEDLQCLESVISSMERSPTKPTTATYNAIISAFANKADVGNAERWLARMQVSPDVASYSALVHACAKAGDLSRAEVWMQKMTQAGIEPNIVTYNSIINACARIANAVKAEQWLDRMGTAGITPSLLTYNSMLNACSKAGDVKRLAKWLSLMQERGVEPDTVSFSTAIHACTQASDPVRAETYLEILLAKTGGRARDKASQANSFCLNSLIQAFARGGNPQRAATWAERGFNDHIEVSGSSLSCVVAAFVRAGDAAVAETWLNRMASEGHPVRGGNAEGGFESVAALWARQGKRDRAAAVRQAAQSARAGGAQTPGRRGGR